eukprot:scaffold36162_cov72-Phaeocystis_antarctica.AAC.3
MCVAARVASACPPSHSKCALAGRLQSHGLPTRKRRLRRVSGHLAHPGGERLRFDPEVVAQLMQLRAALRERLGLGAAGGQLDCGDHHVLGGMLAANELEDAHLVAGHLQQQCAHRVGQHLRRALAVDAVAQRRRQRARVCGAARCATLHLPPHLLVAARRHDDDCGAALHAAPEGVVRRRVARVQRQQDVDAERARFTLCCLALAPPRPALALSAALSTALCAALSAALLSTGANPPQQVGQRALLEAQRLEAVERRRHAVHLTNEIAAQLDPHRLHLAQRLRRQVRVRREGEVAAPAPGVHDAQRPRRQRLAALSASSRRRGQPALLEQRSERLHELLDLAELVRLARPRPPLLVGHAERAQEGRVRRHRRALLSVVRLVGRRATRRRLQSLQRVSGLAEPLERQIRIDRHEPAAPEGAGLQPTRQALAHLGQLHVDARVAMLILEHELQPQALLELHGPGLDALEAVERVVLGRALLGVVAAQRQLDERAVAERLLHLVEEARELRRGSTQPRLHAQPVPWLGVAQPGRCERAEREPGQRQYDGEHWQQRRHV